MVSGGLDSFLAYKKFPKAKLVFIDWGQPYIDMEKQAVSELYEDFVTVTVSGVPVNSNVINYYIPARNLMFATIGVRFGNNICLAGMGDEKCSDKSPEAFKAMSEILSDHSKFPVSVFSPFWTQTKSQAVSEYLKNGNDPELLLKTVSCYGNGQTPCLDCEACFRRFVALASNEIAAPVPSENVIKSYGFHRLQNSSNKNIISIIKSLRFSNIPVDFVDLENLSKDEGPGVPYKIIYTESKVVSKEVICSILIRDNIHFDAVLTGFSKEMVT